MDNNDWGCVKYKPGAAHIWMVFYQARDGKHVWKSKCGRMSTLDFDETTILLANDSTIKKCKKCLAIAKRSAQNPTQEAT